MVTRQMAHHFDEVYATEASETMKWRLQEHGFKVIGIDEWSNNNSIKYDVISCLNLLDRCDKPLNVLQQIQTALTPITGRLVLAVVFPFRPYVEFGEYCCNRNKSWNFVNLCGPEKNHGCRKPIKIWIVNTDSYCNFSASSIYFYFQLDHYQCTT